MDQHPAAGLTVAAGQAACAALDVAFLDPDALAAARAEEPVLVDPSLRAASGPRLHTTLR